MLNVYFTSCKFEVEYVKKDEDEEKAYHSKITRGWVTFKQALGEFTLYRYIEIATQDPNKKGRILVDTEGDTDDELPR